MHTTSNLGPSRQCIKSAENMMSVLGMMKRSFVMVDCEDFMLLYRTYVKPLLEFCIQAFSSHLKRISNVLKKFSEGQHEWLLA